MNFQELKTSGYLFSSDTIESDYTCHDCYEKKWDRAFTNSMDYSDRMFIEERNEILSKQSNLDEDTSKLVKQLVLLYGTGEWKCNNCENMRLNVKDSNTLRTPEKIIEEIQKPCNTCNVMGQVKYSP